MPKPTLPAYLNFPYIAASVPRLRRLEWDPDSPAVKSINENGGFEVVLGYSPRLA